MYNMEQFAQSGHAFTVIEPVNNENDNGNGYAHVSDQTATCIKCQYNGQALVEIELTTALMGSVSEDTSEESEE